MLKKFELLYSKIFEYVPYPKFRKKSSDILQKQVYSV